MNGAKALYQLGRIKDYGTPLKISLRQVWEGYSKNGAYALAALGCLRRNPESTLTELWTCVRQLITAEVGEEPAGSNQGGPTVAFKLWHLGLIQ